MSTSTETKLHVLGGMAFFDFSIGIEKLLQYRYSLISTEGAYELLYISRYSTWQWTNMFFLKLTTSTSPKVKVTQC